MLQSDFSKIEPAELVVKNMMKYGRVLSSRKPLRVKLRHTAETYGSYFTITHPVILG